MEYRRLGNTGLMVSEIGIGCEGFAENDGKNTKALLDAAREEGINYIDLYTSNPVVRTSVGAELLGRREEFILQAHLCSVWKNGQYTRTREIGEVRAAFEEMLKQLQTDYVEVGMIHYVDSLEDWKNVLEGPVLAYAQELKAAGRIHHIGLSSHNPQVALAAAGSGYIEVLMFSINRLGRMWRSCGTGKTTASRL